MGLQKRSSELYRALVEFLYLPFLYRDLNIPFLFLNIPNSGILRHYANSRKAADEIPDEFIELFSISLRSYTSMQSSKGWKRRNNTRPVVNGKLQ
jgi:hypothetical protein